MSEGVEVREAGRALKVHTDTPHLVSLGGGRLSTAVTLHPLPEGHVVLGSGPAADISIQGTGVEPVHCQIENTSGVVMLYPMAEMTAIDGLIVTTPTRLTQGCMICIGRSNYLRFNHPAEARLMKSILPNTRISMVPLNFYPGGEMMDSYLSGKPPMAPRRSPRDSWGDVSNSSSCNSGSEEGCGLGKSSKLEYSSRASLGSARHLSPKVFPPGSSTVSSPASVVLGTNHPGRNYQNSPSPANTNGVQLRSRSATPTNLSFNSVHSSPSHIINGEISRSQSSTPTVGIQSRSPGTPLSSSRSVTCSPAFDRSRSGDSVSLLSGSVTYENIVLGSTASRSGGSDYRGVSTPSPAFNRNPQPYRTTGHRSITPSPGERNTNVLFTNGPRSVTPSPPRASATSSTVGVLSPGHRRSMSAGNHGIEPSRRVTSPTPSYGSNCSMEELNARKEELEQKRKQAQEERMKEQETEIQERARLEEILNMCAEYERQVQSERQSKPPTTPTIHQNRIKTNGSLPRDKRLPSPSSTSGCMSASEDELAEIFTFDLSSAACLSPSVNSPTPTVITDPPRVGPQISAANSNNSPAGVIRSPYENVVIGSPGSITYPQSPRTRIKTIPAPTREVCEVFENRLALSSDYDFVNSLPRSKQQNKATQSMDPSGVSNNRSASDAKIAASNQKANSENKFILPLENGSPTKPCDQTVTPKMNGEVKDRTSADSELSVQESVVDGSSPAEHSKNTLEPKRPPRRKSSRDEGESLRKERGKLLATLSGIKRKITEIEQQEEELLRGLEVERALLDGEWQAQRDKLATDEERLCSLQARVEQLDQDMEFSRQREVQRQTDCRLKLEAADGELSRLEQEVISAAGNPEKQKEVADKLQHQHDILEAERKLFEDLEFRHLEEEASCLARREELQRELTDICVRVEDRRVRLHELEQQRVEIAQGATQESRSLERHLINQLNRLEEVRNKLRIVESQLEELARQGAISSQESSPDASSDIDEPVTPARITANSKQSQDDLDRISRVTMGAPLEMSTGSLGRKTLASLQEIERNRQLHLVQQGSQVIEEERKRVQELKRRVQDEVRAQWEERRQREANCTSLNSVGSDEANSLTSSDIPTESASSDDALEKRSSVPATISNSGGGTDEKNDTETINEENQDMVREKERELERDYDETRPLSDGSSYEHQLAVRMREKAARLQQRPLTRYLPIRSENLNLRHHIESAGHQIELCPHVTIDSTSCRGYLQKMGSKFHHWNKRWFVFDRIKRTLMYYTDRSEKKPRGGAYFQSIEEVYVDHLNSVKSPHPHLTFVVKTIERTFHLMAPSAEAMRIWVDVIFTGAEGYQEFEPGT
ncbi:pleckstrin homology-like domain family B member 1 isoform X2 [Anabrus simplex]|uniref:pleckstrin homology-like domain family B member 1 isoform X2 n=1 Tax=Anabrus simplex TaxID=316456 RepID=UPI0035A2DE85